MSLAFATPYDFFVKKVTFKAIIWIFMVAHVVLHTKAKMGFLTSHQTSPLNICYWFARYFNIDEILFETYVTNFRVEP
jgi:hypothetical protein